MASQFGDLLKQQIKDSPFNQGELADHVGISETSLSNYVRAKALPNVEVAYRLARALGITLDSLFGEPAGQPGIDRVAVPIFDVTLGAGEYGGTAENAAIIGHINFAEVWLRQVVGIEPELAFLAQVLGQSMTELLFDGDLVLGERTRRLDRHGIYAAWLDGDMLIKHVQRDGRVVRLLSENPAYPPIEVREPDRFRIEGRIVRRITGLG